MFYHNKIFQQSIHSDELSNMGSLNYGEFYIDYVKEGKSSDATTSLRGCSVS